MLVLVLGGIVFVVGDSEGGREGEVLEVREVCGVVVRREGEREKGRSVMDSHNTSLPPPRRSILKVASFIGAGSVERCR